MLALPIFPGSRPPSIVGADVLNFCVRDGNRWTHIAINTNCVDGFEPSFICQRRLPLTARIIALSASLVNTFFSEDLRANTEVLTPKEVGDPYRIRTDVNGVRGRCLNHLTNGPLVHLHGLEPGTH